MIRVFIDTPSLKVLFLILFVVVLGSIYMGVTVGLRRRAATDQEPEAPRGTVVGATLGLLGFLLAFTFSQGTSRFEARRHLLVEEVNAIGTAYLRADLLQEPQRSELRKLLREYVDIRAVPIQDVEGVNRMKSESEHVHTLLWEQVKALQQPDRSWNLGGLTVQAINDLIDLHTVRATTVLIQRIPGAVWLALFVVMVVAMFQVGYHFGLGGRHNPLMLIGLALSFCITLWMVIGLDRSSHPSLAVNQQPMLELQASMNSSAP